MPLKHPPQWGAGVLVLLLLAGCTAAPATTAPTPSAQTTTRSASNRPSTAPAGSGAYHLQIPAKSRKQFARTTEGTHEQGWVYNRPLSPQVPYTLEGACIFGIDDQLTVLVTDAGIGRDGGRERARQAITCDGRLHRTRFTVPRRASVELQFIETAPKTVAYALVVR